MKRVKMKMWLTPASEDVGQRSVNPGQHKDHQQVQHWSWYTS